MDQLERGWKADLARRAGMDRSFVHKILSGVKRCPPGRAKALELASAGVIGEIVTVSQWLDRNHEIFRTGGK